jgi:hypothetical protein
LALGEVSCPVLQFSPVSIIPPMLHTHSYIYHQRCMFLSQYFSFPLSVSFHQCSLLIHSSTTNAVCFSPRTSVSPVSIIPPLLHTHSDIYHQRCIMLLSQYFSFPCQYHSTNAPYSFIHLPPTLYNVSLPVLQFPPVSIIPPIHIPITYNLYVILEQFLLNLTPC